MQESIGIEKISDYNDGFMAGYFGRRREPADHKFRLVNDELYKAGHRAGQRDRDDTEEADNSSDD